MSGWALMNADLRTQDGIAGGRMKDVARQALDPAARRYLSGILRTGAVVLTGIQHDKRLSIPRPYGSSRLRPGHKTMVLIYPIHAHGEADGDEEHDVAG